MSPLDDLNARWPVGTPGAKLLELCATVFRPLLDGFLWNVAGGAVRDAIIGVAPKDYDVFIMGDREVDVRKRLLPLGDPLPRGTARPEPFLVESYQLPCGAKVQFMAMPNVHAVEALLDSFDWRVSMFACDGVSLTEEFGQIPVAGTGLRLHRVTYPASTLSRGIRFARRFGMSITASDSCRLVDMAIKDQSR